MFIFLSFMTNELSQRHFPVDGPTVRFLAKKIYPGDDFSVHRKHQSFTLTYLFQASSGWTAGFFKRQGIVRRRGTKKATSKIPENCIPLLRKWHAAMYELSQTCSFILNIDETPVFFDLSDAYTYINKGAHEVLIKCDENAKKR